MSSASGNGGGGRRQGRGGGGGRGRPRGGGAGNGGNRRGGGGGGRGRSNNGNTTNNNYNSNQTRGNISSNEGTSEMTSSDSIMMRDEDVLIAFMPYLRNDDNEAREIHESYQNHQDQHAFLRAAREFLQRGSNGSKSASAQTSTTTRQVQQQQPTTVTPTSQPSTTVSVQPSEASQPTATTGPPPATAVQPPTSFASPSTSAIQPPPAPASIVPLPSILTSATTRITEQQQHAVTFPNTANIPSASSLESPMRNLLVDDDPVVSVPHLAHSSPTPIRPATLPIGSKSPSNIRLPLDSTSSPMPPIFPTNASMNGGASPSIPPKPMFPMSSTPPRPPGVGPGIMSSPFGAVPSPSASLLFALTHGASSPGASNTNNSNGSWLPTTTLDSHPTPPIAPRPLPPQNTTNMDHSYPHENIVNNTNSNNNTPHHASVGPTTVTPMVDSTKSAIPTATSTTAVTPAAVTKREFGPPKRMWMHFDEQPGRLLANDVPANLGQVLDLRPRQELTANWMLPLSYLQQRNPITNPTSLRDALFSLTVGLFRRGCTDNGQNASIISKQILASLGESRNDYPYQVQGNVVIGTVPFYAPRTPGHVVFRLYWQDDPIYTLATGATLNVRVTAEDLDPTLRFILSNLKGKKVNPTSLSSLHALALVMEQIHVPNQHHHQQQQLHHHHHLQQQHQQPFLESAGRALWGCICEARKVADACALEHEKTNAKLAVLEQEVEALKEEITTTAKTQADSEDIAMAVAVAAVADDDDDMDPLDDLAAAIADDFLDTAEPLSHHHNNHKSLHNNHEDDEDDPTASAAAKLREKNRTLLSGRASSERKWRDSQLAFSGILKAAVTNPSIALMLRRELIAKMRLEYDLWCPLCEEFAVPTSLVSSNNMNPTNGSKGSTITNKDGSTSLMLWYRPLNEIPHSAVTGDHFRICRVQRATMQVELLGFDPNMLRLDDILFPKTPRRNSPSHNPADNNHRTMDAAAVNVFNQLSAAMGQLYQEEYATADFVYQQREIIRSQTEKFVALCDLFPPGTKVAIFGSSANGFGSRQSDLDMCVQLPPGAKLVDDEDATGSIAMAKLAEILKEGGMQDVDTVRLTARIPIIRFNCPKPLRDGQEQECIECDLSMHNPLAVLNTSLLRTYAEINPVTRVLAAIIKRWAKARDINDPSRHTLSSYGYIIMLLHFLTYHQRTGNGLVAPVAGPQGKPLRQNRQATPLLPNLQWMDGTWPQTPPGTPYRELPALPNNVRMPHPIEGSTSVNAYFYRPSDPSQHLALQRLFPGQDLSLAILLCSFFRYYAYEFDFKHHVVSLHSTASRGLVEREAKAETDGWRNYSAALTIEDPFETFYDIAHVLRGGYYHRIRREFALAYTKIADAASGRVSTVAWHDKGDVRSMTGLDLINWICETIAPESNEAEKF